MATEQETKRESGNPGGGEGRRDETGKSGIYPVSGPLPAGDAPIRPMASFGQGARGAEGYADAGPSRVEDPVARAQLRAEAGGGVPARRSCRAVMTASPTFCLAGDPARRAAELMRSEDVGSIPVVADPVSRRLVGIVTDRDLTLKVVADGHDAEAVVVGAVMTQAPGACTADEDLDHVLELMEKRRVRRVPIVDADGRLVGIIAQADVARRLAQPEKVAEVLEEVSQPV